MTPRSRFRALTWTVSSPLNKITSSARMQTSTLVTSGGRSEVVELKWVLPRLTVVIPSWMRWMRPATTVPTPTMRATCWLEGRRKTSSTGPYCNISP